MLLASEMVRISYSCPSGWPPLTRVRPLIADEDRRRGRLDPPPAQPAHCKPWLDGHRVRVLVRFPFDASVVVRGHPNRPVDFSITSGGGDVRPEHAAIVSTFSTTHFGVATEYTIRTESGVGLLILPPPSDGAPQPVCGLVESWWYPKPLFVVFKAPGPGAVVTFRQGQPMCTLAPVLCDPPSIEAMTAEEAEATRAECERYERFSADHPELRWTSAEGQKFSSRYKVLSKQGPSRADVALD